MILNQLAEDQRENGQESDHHGQQGDQTLDKDTDQVIKGRAATIAWLVLILTITFVAAIGILCEQEATAVPAAIRIPCQHLPTVIPVLAAIGAISGLTAVVATLQRKTKTANGLAISAALSAVAGLLVRHAETIPQIFDEVDSQSLIVAAVFLVIIISTGVFFFCNRENLKQADQHDRQSPRTASNADEPDTSSDIPP